MYIDNELFCDREQFDGVIQLLLAWQAHGLPSFMPKDLNKCSIVNYQGAIQITDYKSSSVAINPMTCTLEPYIYLSEHNQANFLSNFLTQYYKALTDFDLDILEEYLPYYPPEDLIRYRLMIAKRRLELIVEN